MKNSAAAILIVFFHTVAVAGTIETVLSTLTETPNAGQNLVFSVFFNNTGDTETRVDIPGRVHCVLKFSDQQVETTATLVRPSSFKSFRICGKCFERVRYSLALPQTLSGPVNMKIPDFDGASIMFRVDAEIPQPERHILLNGCSNNLILRIGKYHTDFAPNSEQIGVSINYRAIDNYLPLCRQEEPVTKFGNGTFTGIVGTKNPYNLPTLY